MSEKKELRVSLVQMQVTRDKKNNLNKAISLIKEASKSNPDLILLPENFYLFETKEELLKQAETIDGEAVTKLRELASELNLYILAGTMKIKEQNSKKLRNSSILINDKGEIQAVYNKIHSFDANFGESNYEGSAVEKPGEDLIVTEVKGVPIGLTVCFDVRFPELYRSLALKGAKVILVPSLFMMFSGKDHWEVLLRARAIENQVYIVAPATCGKFPPNDEWSYGRSLVADPWGTVVSQASDFETIITSDLNLNWVDEVREKLPNLKQRRPHVYQL